MNSFKQDKYKAEFPLFMINDNGGTLENFISTHKDEINSNLLEFGSIVFRNFNVTTATEFEYCSQLLCKSLYTDYGDLPPTYGSKKIYGATPYPHISTIHFHNEASHTPIFPLKQLFCCVQPASEGGGLRVVDGRIVLQKLPTEIVEEFNAKGLIYVRNFIPYLDVSWQDFFKTSDRNELESICKKQSLNFEWKKDVFCTRIVAPAIIKHPFLNEPTWFNQIQLHHPSMLDDEIYEFIAATRPECEFPRYVCFGDSTPIPKEVITIISEILEQESVTIQAQKGDIIYNDNLLVAHSRLPYKGDRKVLVALGEPITIADTALLNY